MARPRKTWDEKDVRTFKSLCQIMCTKREICSVMGLDAKTLDRLIDETFGADVPHEGERLTFADAFTAFSASGRVSLRRKQYEMAMDGDRSMLVWLGKNYLGQSEPRQRAEEKKDEDKPKTEKASVLELAQSGRAARAKKAI